MNQQQEIEEILDKLPLHMAFSKAVFGYPKIGVKEATTKINDLITKAKIDGESTGAINILEGLASNGTISKKVKLEMLSTVFAWKELQGEDNE